MYHLLICMSSWEKFPIQIFCQFFLTFKNLLPNLLILPASWEICVQVKKQQMESDMEQQTSSKLGKEYIKAV